MLKNPEKETSVIENLLTSHINTSALIAPNIYF